MPVAGTHGIEVSDDDHVSILFEQTRNRGVDPVERRMPRFDRQQ